MDLCSLLHLCIFFKKKFQPGILGPSYYTTQLSVLGFGASIKQIKIPFSKEQHHSYIKTPTDQTHSKIDTKIILKLVKSVCAWEGGIA